MLQSIIILQIVLVSITVSLSISITRGFSLRPSHLGTAHGLRASVYNYVPLNRNINAVYTKLPLPNYGRTQHALSMSIKSSITMLTKSPRKATVTVPKPDSSLIYGLGKIAYSLFPFSPEASGRRKSLLKELVKDTVWTIDQIQGTLNVNVPVRSTIIKLKDGGLFVHNPVAPTRECLDMVRNLESQHGKVKYIVLATLGVEHKGSIGAFSANFPSSEVYVQPGQYSFPVDLPTSFFFPISRNIKEIPVNSVDAPWFEEFDHVVLGPLKPKGAGGFGETAFFHRITKTLLVTDSIVRVDDEPPEILNDDPRALLYHARDTMLQVVEDTPEIRKRGWRRIVLFALYFQPSGIKVNDLFESIKILDKVEPDMKLLGRGNIPISEGLYPWDWVKDEIPNFRSLQGGLLVAPILQKLIFNRKPDEVARWVDKICSWQFTRIIPCHLANDIKASPSDLKEAFQFLYEQKNSNGLFSFFSKKKLPQLDKDDCKLLSDLSEQLTTSGTLFPEAPRL